MCRKEVFLCWDPRPRLEDGKKQGNEAPLLRRSESRTGYLWQGQTERHSLARSSFDLELSRSIH